MSADRYEITDEDGVISVNGPGDQVQPWDQVVAYALRQQLQDIAKLRTDLAAAVAERDSYRDEFSGLCHALSVGSEGRPEMTAADWRKRVDDGVEFLLRPLIAQRDELVAAYEFARHVVRDDPGITPRGALIRQSDEIGRLRARLAAIDSAHGSGYK